MRWNELMKWTNGNIGKTKVSSPIDIQKDWLKKEYSWRSKHGRIRLETVPNISEKEREEQTMIEERLSRDDI